MPVLAAFKQYLNPVDLYFLFWLGLSIVILLNTLANLLFFRKPKASVIPNDELPFISILVPARNEESNIEACIRSLLAQNYPNFEVIALDDSSEDLTYDILCRLRNQDHRLRVLVGASLPDGWCGKPHACWQMANAALGEYLLLTDADCLFAPDALLFAVGGLTSTQSDVLSLMPNYLAVSLWEKLTIPLLVAIPLGFLPFYFVRNSQIPAFAAANGAFIFLSKAVYFAVDGHRAVRMELTEDVKFSQHVKRMGKTLSYLDGNNVYKVRMYTSFHEIWVGFTRILMPAFNNVWTCLFGMFLVLNLSILPFFFAVIGFLTGQSWAALAGATYLMTILMRIVIALALDRDNVLFAVVNPVSWGVAFAIGCGSIFRNLSGRAEWKGRTYKTPSRK